MILVLTILTFDTNTAAQMWDDSDIEMASMPQNQPHNRKAASRKKKQKEEAIRILDETLPDIQLIPKRSLKNNPFNKSVITISALDENYTRFNGLLFSSLIICMEGIAYWMVIQYILASTTQIDLKWFMLSIAIIGAVTAAVFIFMMIWYFGQYSRLDDSVVYGMIKPVVMIGFGGMIGLVLFNSVKNDAGFDYMAYDAYQTARFYSVLLFMNVFFAAGVMYTPRMIMSHKFPMRKLKDVIVIELDADEAQSLKRRKGVDTLILDKKPKARMADS